MCTIVIVRSLTVALTCVTHSNCNNKSVSICTAEEKGLDRITSLRTDTRIFYLVSSV